ncbi:MAG: hypothetical protein A4S09_00680 [Proteobacteria bacterium SG_bin7]|nr:MAG: hypothetical protein A4S09_00680 [Proteobacteria bacterium SG_bin7]
MKNLYISLIAAGLVACGSSKHSNPGAKTSDKPQPVVIADPVIVAAATAYKDQGYDPNTAENKALAEDLIGADLMLNTQEGEAKEARFGVFVGSSCEDISKIMPWNSGKDTPVFISAPGLNGDLPNPPEYANLENKCIGANGGCETVAVLFSKQKDRNSGGKAAQVAIAFAKKEDGSYRLVGWPTTKQEAFKNVEEARVQCDKKDKQTEQQPEQKESAPTQKPEPIL